MNFEEVYEEYFEYVRKRHKKQGFITVTHDFKLYVLPYFKSSQLNFISNKDLIAWQTTILGYDFKNSYNKRLRYVLNDFLKFCYNSNYLDNNLLLSPFPKRIEYNTHTVYTIHQFRKFRLFIENFVIKEFFNFMYFYGTRPSEAMALRFCDKRGRYIRIIHSIHRKGDRELDTPKNKSSIRAFKISLLMCFRIWLLKRYYLKIYGVFKNDYFIFGGIKPLAPTTIDRYKKKAFTNAKLPNITQHEFRHSYATRKIHKKTPIDIVSHSLGHSKVSTTVDIYLHQEKNSLNEFLREI